MKKLKLFTTRISIIGIMLFLQACAYNIEETTHEEKDESHAVTANAVCVLHPTEGNQVTGSVTFNQTESGIKIIADIEGLTPGKHGFHIHEYGDCSEPDGTSAGGHFNPENKAHGALSDVERHVGDLGNLVADENGIAHLEITDTIISMSGPHSIIGKGIIVHAGEDDLKSQPTGAAGARVACGVIGVAK